MHNLSKNRVASLNSVDFLVTFFPKDVDECLTNGGKGPCQDSCENLPGTFKCRCTIPGYELDDDGVSCIGKMPLMK